jgi:hypothetical protein
MDLLEKFAPKFIKKTLVLTNVGKRAVGGGYHILVDLGIISRTDGNMSMEEHTCLHSEPVRKRAEKKKKKKPWY